MEIQKTQYGFCDDELYGELNRHFAQRSIVSAFMLGVSPLAIATGAGSASRIAIGTGVIGGMLAALLLATFFIPMFYVLVRRLMGRAPTRKMPTPHTGV